MRFNCHAHIFNFQSVFTNHTLNILINRIIEMDLPKFIEKALTDEIGKIILKTGSFADEEQLLHNVIKRIRNSSEYKDLAGLLTPKELSKLEVIGGEQLENLAVNSLLKFFKQLGKYIFKNDDDYKKSTIIDAIDFVRIALLPDIARVTDKLMGQLKSRDSIIALTMDITENGTDDGLFERQIENTSKMVLAYPGRIFPFIAVNTRRSDHLRIMKSSLTGRGFVGIKLYPSLGYDIYSDEMKEVFKYCRNHNTPMLMHCAYGGFYYKDEFRKNSSPELWGQILAEYPKLKICFGHFGGDKDLTATSISIDSWTGKILTLMDNYSNVYADIAYHTGAMKGRKEQSNYFKNIKDLMNHDVYGGRLLFGTDYFLVRKQLKEKNYWKFFEENLSKDIFCKMAEENPIEYLGLRNGTHSPSENIENYVRYVYSQQKNIERKVAPWIKKEVKVLFGLSTTIPAPDLGSKWAWNNDAHFYVYSFMRNWMRESHKELPFKAVGRLQMRQMKYWNKEFESIGIWKQKLIELSDQLNSFCRVNGADYEMSFDTTKAKNQLEDAFNKGDMQIYQLSQICDRIYKYNKEIN